MSNFSSSFSSATLTNPKVCRGYPGIVGDVIVYASLVELLIFSCSPMTSKKFTFNKQVFIICLLHIWSWSIFIRTCLRNNYLKVWPVELPSKKKKKRVLCSWMLIPRLHFLFYLHFYSQSFETNIQIWKKLPCKVEVDISLFQNCYVPFGNISISFTSCSSSDLRLLIIFHICVWFSLCWIHIHVIKHQLRNSYSSFCLMLKPRTCCLSACTKTMGCLNA